MIAAADVDKDFGRMFGGADAHCMDRKDGPT